jgi:hypothetical protein
MIKGGAVLVVCSIIVITIFASTLWRLPFFTPASAKLGIGTAPAAVAPVKAAPASVPATLPAPAAKK